jgi:DNA-binding FadR family transcriptional regulator
MKASLSIAADFRTRIARGDLRAGEPLPVESELMDELGVSKGVVREALRILETEGLVEVRRGLGGGPRVRHPSISDAAKPIGVYLQIGDVHVTDVWESRDRLIGAALERLATRGDERDLGPFQASVDALAALVGDFDAYYPQLLDVGEQAVLATGSATEHVIVMSLRHIIAVELEAATRAVADIDQAVAVEVVVADAWAEAVRHIRAHRPRAARRAYDRQADIVRTGLYEMMKEATVGEVIVAPPVHSVPSAPPVPSVQSVPCSP